MKKRLLFLILLMTMPATHALAGGTKNAASISAQQQTEQCLETQSCSLQLNLELLKGMHIRSGALLAEITQICTKQGYSDCLDDEKTSEWLALNERSKDMMSIISKSTALAEHVKPQPK